MIIKLYCPKSHYSVLWIIYSTDFYSCKPVLNQAACNAILNYWFCTITIEKLTMVNYILRTLWMQPLGAARASLESPPNLFLSSRQLWSIELLTCAMSVCYLVGQVRYGYLSWRTVNTELDYIIWVKNQTVQKVFNFQKQICAEFVLKDF